MQLTSQALQIAAGALQHISETTPGERGRRAGIVALALRSVERLLEEPEAAGFLALRVEREIDGLAGGSERSLLGRMLAVARDGRGPLGDLLMEYAAGLEEARRLPEADAVMTLAVAVEPGRADLALQAGRVARLLGDRDRALDLYRAASELDASGGTVARLAAIGEAVIADDPERALSRVIRRSVGAHDHEAAAVGLEERARVRRGNGDRRGAARDLGFAAARFADSVDRARVAHQLADLFVAGNDPEAAREALLFALSCGDRSQRDHAQSRLHTISRDVGDHLGMRRWRSFNPPALVSLSARPVARVASSAAPEIMRWRERLEALVAPAS
jgi:tetratricopeptide (TPR) repeat protein